MHVCFEDSLLSARSHRRDTRRDRLLAMRSVALLLLLTPLGPLFSQEDCGESVVAKIRIDPGHPWRPPFGLERVGKPITAWAAIKSDQRPSREYFLVGYVDQNETERHVLNMMSKMSNRFERKPDSREYDDRALFTTYPDEIVLYAQCRFDGQPVELARAAVEFPEVEAEATARPEELIHPLDLGTIFVPHDWLILAGGQKTVLDIAAISYASPIPDARVTAWFESDPHARSAAKLKINSRARSSEKLLIDPVRTTQRNDVLHVSITDDGKELWHKKIQTMLVPTPPQLPEFGATELKLRYDPPISVNTAGAGKLSFIDYDQAWDPHLKDVVVSFPGSASFVFWRGSSYIPFWAGKRNTGMCYEWAETTPPPDGFVDSVEPLMDKVLKYGRVEVIESTPARVHVRWTYQSNDFTYKVWGDQAAEDYYFYPDGFGTRVLNLKRTPGTDYELSEFIVLTPQSAYPFDVLPSEMVDMLYLDGEKRTISFPGHALASPRRSYPDELFENLRRVPAIYRIRLHKDEPAAAIYFHASDNHFPKAPFAPFHDRGYLVTPAYWGSHWPLSRGKTTGRSIDDRIRFSPAHNSLLTWGTTNRPTPISSGEIQMPDTLGRSRPMTVERWVWLIGMSDASDSRLLEWAQSFSRPPSLEVEGAVLDLESYVPERRAFRLRVEDERVVITIKPVSYCVNPVFELLSAPSNLSAVKVDGQALPRNRYAWDGKTLWLDASFSEPQQIEFQFE